VQEFENFGLMAIIALAIIAVAAWGLVRRCSTTLSALTTST
jgi:hypothetical protein